MKKGLIEVYTGDGKGKTTSAIGLSIRAISHGLSVCFIYFFKDPKRSSEHKVLEKLGINTFFFAKKHPDFFNIDKEVVRKECLEGIEFVKKLYQKKKYDLIILDEINIALRDGFLKEEVLLEILEEKPECVELILTGRGAKEKIIKMADLVSEIKKIKHPYDVGIKGRKGIEY